MFEIENEIETLAANLIAKYPDGYLTEIEVGWPCGIAIRAPVRGLDTPRAIVNGSYMELRAFENAYTRMQECPEWAATSNGVSSC